MNKMGKYLLILVSVFLLAACSNSEPRDKEQIVQNERDIIDQRRAEREKEKQLDDSFETLEANQALTDNREDYGTKVVYNLDNINNTMNSPHDYMSDFEIQTWENLLTDKKSKVLFDYETHSYLIIPDDDELISMYMYYIETDEMSRESQDLVDMYALLSAEIAEGGGRNYQLIVLNPYNYQKALVAVTEGIVLYNEFNQ